MLDVRARMASLPAIERYLTVDELLGTMRRLAETYPALARLRRVGTSRLGEPIELLSIGNGHRSAFLFGCPHPNEPIGAMMVVHLARALCDNAALRESLDFTWHLIPCIDPDGTRLNEGWFAGPFTPTNYARHFFRPASAEQVEWTFPVAYKRLYFDRALPETQALMRVIDEVQPTFLFSLHNAGFGGVYYYVSREVAPLYETLHRLPEWEGLPLDLGEPETPYMQPLAPAIYRMPTAREGYDFLEAHGADPAARPGGTSSHEYAARYGTFTLVVEMPYFDDPCINDTRPTDRQRREVVLAGLELDQELATALRPRYDAVVGELRGDSPFQHAIAGLFHQREQRLEAERRWARESDELARPATIAETFSNDQLKQFYRLLNVGQCVRMLEGEVAIGNGTPAIRGALAETRQTFGAWAARLESALTYRAISIRQLVAVQYGAALATAAQLQEG